MGRRSLAVLASVLSAASLAGCSLGGGSSAPPAPALPAAIIGWSPGLTRNIPLAGPLTVYFSHAVDRTSVERSWRLSPAVPGRFLWNGSALSFRPAHLLSPGASYRLSVGSGAHDLQNRPIGHALAVSFTAGSALQVQSFTPGKGTKNLPLNALIAVSFNHPMVPLVGLDASPPNPPGWNVHISPVTAGRGSWLGTSTWVFHPATGLSGSSTYTVSLPASVADVWGTPLGKGLSWSFSTVAPGLLATYPRNGSRSANPAGPVKATFNQPMDPRTTAAAFRLSAGSTTIPGTTSWHGTTLVFRPRSALDATVAYTASISSGARSANGSASLPATTWTFRVAPPPGITSSDPKNGATVQQSYVGLTFNSPMDLSSLNRHLTISPSVPDLQTYLDSSGSAQSSVLTLYGQLAPSTHYTVTLSPGSRDQYGRTMASAYTLHFATGPLPPSLVLYGAAGAGPGIAITAGRVENAPLQTVNVSRMRIQLIRTTAPLTAPTACFGSQLQPPPGTTVRTWDQAPAKKLNTPQNLGLSLSTPSGKPLSPGVYWLGGSAGGAASCESVLVSNVSLTLKSGTGQALVWVTSAGTGSPVAGVPVVLRTDNGKPATVRTDGNGVSVFKVNSNQDVESATVDDGTHFGGASLSWQAQSRGPEFGPYTPPPDGTYLYTDRPIYRPGQTVHFRGVLWKDTDGVYSSLGHVTVNAGATDMTGAGLYKGTLRPDAYGTVHGSFKLPSKAATGGAYLSVSLPNGQQSFATFTIAAYRKPEFLTTVTPEHSTYAQGQTLRATVGVRYLFGAAVAGQQVSWTAYTQDQTGGPAGWDAYQFGDAGAIQAQMQAVPPPFGGGGGPFGTVLTTGTGLTDAAGKLVISLPVNLAHKAFDQTITLEATTTDINHQSVTGRAAVLASRAFVAIGLQPTDFVATPGARTGIDVQTVMLNGQVAPRRSLTATIYRRTYTSKLVDNGPGATMWQQVPHDAEVGSQSVHTDAKGRASFTFTPSTGGTYYVVVTGSDGGGHTARSAIFVYASATDAVWGSTRDTTLHLQSDRSVYSAGDTARILVASPFSHATALVTVERTTVRRYWVVKLNGRAPTVSIPLGMDDIPNVYVGVTLYRGPHGTSAPDWRSGFVPLHLKLSPRRLTIRLTQNRTHYHPGDTAVYTVTTLDASHRPVQAQLSLALVDEAVLALAPDPAPSIVTALYGDTPLEVSTASDGVVSIDHFPGPPGFRVQPPFQGGGGGGGGAPAAKSGLLPSQTAHVRQHFKDTAYWKADLTTDASGHATVRVTLPDNLTTWRLTARGITSGFQVGSAHLETLSTQDVVLRPATPRFLEQGDTVQLGVAVNNNLAQPVHMQVSLGVSGALLQSAPSVALDLPANGEKLLLWQAAVGTGDTATLIYRATPSGGVQGDAVQVSLPVHPPLTSETVATSGQVFDRQNEEVVLPSNAVSTPGALTVDVSSALTSGIGKAMTDFTPTPYDSNEDLANRLLAAVALRSLPATLTRLSAAKLDKTIPSAVASLQKNQAGDGGWPWATGSPGSDPIITADVMQALLSAHASSTTIARGKGYLSRHHSGPAEERARILWLLAQAGAPQTATALALAAKPRTSPLAQAYLALALHAAGQAGPVGTLLASLDSSAMVSATGAHWEGRDTTAVETTAAVLGALTSLAPNDPLVPAAARWLALARQGSDWDCPRDTAQALAALAVYAGAAHEGQARYTYSVLLDGAAKLSGTGAGTPRAGRLSVPVARLQPGAHTVSVVRDNVGGSLGPGPLYYVARLQYYLRAASIAPLNEGVSVSRQYVDLAGHPLTTIAAGSLFQVVLTVSTGQTLEHLQIVDPLPAGVESVDQSLSTSRQGLFPGWHVHTTAGTADLGGYIDHTDLLDDQTDLYIGTLPPGTYQFVYLAQGTVSGRYAVAPVQAREVLFPEVFGRGAGETLTVR